MQSIQALRERRAHFLKETRNLLDNNPGAKWGAEQQKKYDENLAEIERVEAELSRMERMAELEAEKPFPQARDVIARIDRGAKSLSEHVKAALESIGEQARVKEYMQVCALHAKWLRVGDKGMSEEDWATIRNTMSTTTGSEGGFTVPSEISSVLIDSLKFYAAMMQVAESIRTSDGRPLNYPTSDGTAETGEIIAQNVTATGADPTFGTVGLNVFKFGSKIVACPIELLQDSTIDIEAFIRKRLMQRIGRILNNKFTVGVGTTEPDGIVPRTTTGKTGTTGQTTTVIYDDLVDVIDAVDIAYQGPNCKWMFNQNSRKVIRKIKDTAGRPIWMPSYDRGIAGGFADELLGFPVQINNDMANMAANAFPIIFGDFSYYKIRVAMEVSLFRFTDSAYTKLGQVGFLAWMRAGGNLVDTGATRTYRNSAT